MSYECDCCGANSPQLDFYLVERPNSEDIVTLCECCAEAMNA